MMTQVGDILNSDLSRLSREYSFSKISKYMPRGITPTDLDAPYLIHCRTPTDYGAFLWFEFKMLDKKVHKGQQEAFDALLFRGRPLDCLFICEHPRLDRVDVDPDIHGLTIRRWDEERSCICETKTIWHAELKLGEWIQDWFAHVEERPNSFISNFRKFAEIY